MHKKILVPFLIVLLVAATNYMTYYFSRVNCNNRSDSIEIDTNKYSSTYGRYKLRSGLFSNVLICYTVADASFMSLPNYGVLRLYPVIAEKKNGVLVYADVRRGQKYFSSYNKYLEGEVSDGDTVWINAMIGEEPTGDLSKPLQITLTGLYRQIDYTQWRQSFFARIREH